MHRRVVSVLFVIAGVSSGCHYLPGLQPPKQVPPEVRTSATQYRPGDSGGIVVINRGNRTIGFNSCPVQLEQLTGTAWHSVPGGIRGPETIASCSTSFMLLGTGDSTQTRFTLAPTVAPGTYRLRLARVEGIDSHMGTDSTGARTNSFTVAP